ncbi:hypothetical protein HNP33_003705 [Comamonas odontotermitis]|uniref:Phage tail protein n=1 Tax=Comamonas odontotermitis TaxID=379895 RepID=A0ABR6RKA0_9BURK|nr:phage tail tube protein [Comamonas odontotermitis]MBB6579591.1 hypothetical protein [Comamonas odontotermitis]
MAYAVSTGTRFAISSAYGAAIPVSAISNGNPAVITATGHALAQYAPFILKTGWEDLNDAVLRVGTAATNSITLEDEDTTDTVVFPPGSSAGSVVPITGWTELQQVTSISPSGGEQQYAEISPLSQKYGVKIPTTRSAMSWELEFGWDPTLNGYKEALKASRANKLVAIRMALPSGGSISYGYGYISVQETPVVASNAITTGRMTLSMLRPLKTYQGS